MGNSIDYIIKNFEECLEHIAKEKQDIHEEFGYKDSAIVTLGYSISDKAKDINLLLKNERSESIEIILRTIFEQSVYICAILNKDTENRAIALMDSFNIQEMKKMKKLGSSLGLDLENMLQEKMEENPLLKSSKKMSIDDYIEIYKKRFEQKSKVKVTKKKDNKFYEQWYNLDGKTPNMRKLVEEIKDNVFSIQTHEFVYGLGSMEVHGIGAMRQLEITKSDDGFGYLSISKEINMLTVISPLCSFINRLAQIIDNEYSTKKDNFYKTRSLNIKRHYNQLKENGYKL